MAQKGLMPQNIDAEKALLGSLFVGPEMFAEVVDIVRSEDFYHNQHRIIFQAMASLNRRGIPSDMITVMDEIEQTANEEDLERFDRLAYDDLTSSMPVSVHARHYAELVRRAADCRRLLRAASDMAALAYSQDSQALEQAEKMLFELRGQAARQGNFKDMNFAVCEEMDELQYVYENRGKLIGVPTGYRDLDITLGGMQRSDLLLVAGRPSMGKTAFALSIAYRSAIKGSKVAVFSLEMGRKLLTRRLISMSSKIDMQRLRSGWIEEEEWEAIERAGSKLSGLSIHIDDTAGNPIASMRSQLRRLKQSTKGLDLVIVDYIGLIEPDTESAKRDNLVQQVSAISRGLKALAREFDVPVVALCQLSRAVESRQNKRPMLSDLRDSGSLEQDADVVLFIYREDYYTKLSTPPGETFEPTNLAEILVAKHRNGPTGEVSLYYKADETAFYDLEELVSVRARGE